MDTIIRATAAGAKIRAFAATTKEMVETARAAHNTSPIMTAALGRMMTAGAMMGIMQKGDKDIVTLMIQSDGPAKGLTVTADSHGRVKGFPYVADVMLPPNAKGKLDVGGAIGRGFLRVIKDLGLKDPYVGEVELLTGEIGDDITRYFVESEQVPSSVGLGVLMNKDNTVAEAGGFIIQVMPFCDDEIIDKLEENLSKITSVTDLLKSGKTPKEILEIALDGFDIEFNDEVETKFYCNCSKDRFAKGLISLDRKEMKEMIDEGKTIEVNCSFCGKHYYFTKEELIEIDSLR